MNRKTFLKIVPCFMLSLFAIFGAFPARLVHAATVRSVEVRGQGVVNVKPDIAVVTVGVSTKSSVLATAQSENTTRMSEVLDAIKAQGVEDKDIQTVSFYTQPDYDYSRAGENRVVGYTVYNVVEVTVRDIDMAGSVLSRANDAGANINRGVRFDLSNKDAYYEQALAEAVKHGKSKADAALKPFGIASGVPVYIGEGYTYSEYYARSYTNGAVMAATNDSVTVPIESGEMQVTAYVTLRFEY